MVLIMNKMKLAHDYAVKYMDSYLGDMETLVSVSWKYADLMFEQEEKRKVKGVPEAIEQEWQPDWSQAPDDAYGYCIGIGGKSVWLDSGLEYLADAPLFKQCPDSEIIFNPDKYKVKK